MAEQLFERRCRVLIVAPLAGDYMAGLAQGAIAGAFGSGLATQAVEISGLRTQFQIKKSLAKDPNTATISITNLAEHTRASLQAKGARVILQAGYRDNIGQIFRGDVRIIDHTLEGPDWVTKIESGDGERANMAARISTSFGAGTAIADVANRVASSTGLDFSAAARKLTDALPGKQYVQGYTAHGRAADVLDSILTSLGYEWSVQDGRVQILGKNETTTERIVTLSSAHGLIGSPEYGTSHKKDKPPTLKFKAMLMPEIKPGCRIDFDSVKHKGTHRVLSVEYRGDTEGGDWEVAGEAQVS